MKRLCPWKQNPRELGPIAGIANNVLLITHTIIFSLLACLPATAEYSEAPFPSKSQAIQVSQEPAELEKTILRAAGEYYLELNANTPPFAEALQEQTPKFSTSIRPLLKISELRSIILSIDHDGGINATSDRSEEPARWVFKVLIGQPVASQLFEYPIWVVSFSKITATLTLSSSSEQSGDLLLEFAGFATLK